VFKNLSAVRNKGSEQFSSIPFFNKANPSTSLANLCLVIFVCTPPTFHKTFLHTKISVAFTDWAKKFHKMILPVFTQNTPIIFKGKKKPCGSKKSSLVKQNKQ